MYRYKSFSIYLYIVFYRLCNLSFACEYFCNCSNPHTHQSNEGAVASHVLRPSHTKPILGHRPKSCRGWVSVDLVGLVSCSEGILKVESYLCILMHTPYNIHIKRRKTYTVYNYLYFLSFINFMSLFFDKVYVLGMWRFVRHAGVSCNL